MLINCAEIDVPSSQLIFEPIDWETFGANEAERYKLFHQVGTNSGNPKWITSLRKRWILGKKKSRPAAPTPVKPEKVTSKSAFKDRSEEMGTHKTDDDLNHDHQPSRLERDRLPDQPSGLQSRKRRSFSGRTCVRKF
jgi:hypothetical protein